MTLAVETGAVVDQHVVALAGGAHVDGTLQAQLDRPTGMAREQRGKAVGIAVGKPPAARDRRGAPGVRRGVAGRQQRSKAANRIGFPVLIKAAAGGGGKGIRIVRDAKAFACVSQVLDGPRKAAATGRPNGQPRGVRW